ncbi:MAG: NUDIX domain-containing protein [Paracoccaceae bacterium]
MTYLRDDHDGLPWRNLWDLPGGGREGDETAETCLLREVEEEFGLQLPPERLIWRRVWPSMVDASRPSVFFAGHITADEIAAIRFGDEGQRWEMMPILQFLSHRQAVPEMQRRADVAVRGIGADR